MRQLCKQHRGKLLVGAVAGGVSLVRARTESLRQPAPLAAWAVFVSNAVWAHHVTVTLGGWRLSRLVVRVIGRV